MRRLFWTILLAVLAFSLVLNASQQAWSGQPEITVSADGPFPMQAYGPGEGIYVGELLVSGKTSRKLDLKVPDLAEVRLLNTSRHDEEFNVGVTFVFAGEPGNRQIQIMARLLDPCGNVLQSQSRLCHDARTIPGNHSLGFYMPPARYNSETLRFKDCAHLPVQRVEVTLTNVM